MYPEEEPKGITLMEGLIVGGIVALLLFATGIALTSARTRARDYKRLTDVTRLQASLELFFNDSNSYPITENGKIALGQTATRCLSSSGFVPSCSGAGRVYMDIVPNQTTIGLKGSDLQVYAYESDGETYAISLVIEKSIPQAEVTKGMVCAYPGQSIRPARAGACEL